jgi:hypothetical protein
VSYDRGTVLVSLIAIGVLSALIGGCVPERSDDRSSTELRMASIDRFPVDVRRAPVSVGNAYRFAATNAELLSQIPCYCGCGSMGHTSNVACYLTDPENPSESAIEPHALGCSICVDITQDVMRLKRRGSSLADIYAFIDSTYARYGPSNFP